MTSEVWQFPNWESAHKVYCEIGQEFAEAETAAEISAKVGKELYAEALLAATGTVDERKAKAELDPEYKSWARDHAAKLGRKRSLQKRIDAADVWFRMVQTTSANIRAERTFQ